MTTILRDSFTDADEQAAYDLAVYAHTGQTRRGTKIPYIVHPVAVALKLREFGHAAHHLIAATLLHDTVEETRDDAHRRYRVTVVGISQRFGEKIANLVDQLTTPAKLALQSQAEADAEEIARLSRIDVEAKTIKLADIYCNIDQIMAQDPTFACPYLLRKEMQMSALLGGDRALWTQTMRLIQEKKYWMYKPVIETVTATVEPGPIDLIETPLPPPVVP